MSDNLVYHINQSLNSEGRNFQIFFDEVCVAQFAQNIFSQDSNICSFRDIAAIQPYLTTLYIFKTGEYGVQKKKLIPDLRVPV